MACCGFLLPLKSNVSAGFKLANLGSNGKHGNHYTTEEIQGFSTGGTERNGVPASLFSLIKICFDKHKNLTNIQIISLF
jgi:hypothetical protein